MNAFTITLLPLFITIFLLVVLSALRPKGAEMLSFILSVVATLTTLILLPVMLTTGNQFFGGSIIITERSMGISLITEFLIFVALILTDGYLPKIRVSPIDWRMLVLIIAVGSITLASANDLGTLFISLELISIPSYVLAGFSRQDPRSNEAGLKYMILGLIGSAIFLLGVSFLYGAVGEFKLSAVETKVISTSGELALMKFSLALFIAALFFKTGVAPLHWWLMDVYQGSTMAALSIIATVTKIALFGTLATLLTGPFHLFEHTWLPFLMSAALLSFFLGGVQGLTQSNLKRILAASSVMNAGFILLSIPFATVRLSLFYLLVYGIMNITLIACWMSFGTKDADVDNLDDLKNIGKVHPFLASAFTISLISLAGIPLTAGFASKFAVIFSVFRRAVGTTMLSDSATRFVPYSFTVAGAGAIFTVLSVYFYFRMIRKIWFHPVMIPEIEVRDQRWNYVLVAFGGSLLILSLGLYPGLYTL